MKYIKHLLTALFCSINGFRCVLNEKAFRIESILSLFLIPFVLLSNISALEKALLIYAIFFVLVVEILNTAIEKTIDRISLERHSLSKNVKDIGSCAVLFSIVQFLFIWGIILLSLI